MLQVTRILNKENVKHCQLLLSTSPKRSASNAVGRIRTRPLTPHPGSSVCTSDVRSLPIDLVSELPTVLVGSLQIAF